MGVPGMIFGVPGVHLACFEGPWGRLGGPFGALGGALGILWAALAVPWGCLGMLLGCLWGPLGALGGSDGPLGLPWYPGGWFQRSRWEPNVRKRYTCQQNQGVHGPPPGEPLGVLGVP